jgi:hypothetical protein
LQNLRREKGGPWRICRVNGLTWGWKPTASSGITITGSTTGSSTVQVKLFTSFQQQNKRARLATAPYICVLGDIEQLQVYKYKKGSIQHANCNHQLKYGKSSFIVKTISVREY